MAKFSAPRKTCWIITNDIFEYHFYSFHWSNRHQKWCGGLRLIFWCKLLYVKVFLMLNLVNRAFYLNWGERFFCSGVKTTWYCSDIYENNSDAVHTGQPRPKNHISDSRLITKRIKSRDALQYHNILSSSMSRLPSAMAALTWLLLKYGSWWFVKRYWTVVK